MCCKVGSGSYHCINGTNEALKLDFFANALVKHMQKGGYPCVGPVTVY